MQRIKLPATDSTNAHLKRLLQERGLPDGTLVAAGVQTRGRGQRGAGWESDQGKNLTFSVLKRFSGFPAQQHFRLNMAVSLAIVGVLDALEIPQVSIKWPNDILSGPYKVCGILIENSLQSAGIAHSIVGIGLNVNQREFPGLPAAASLATRAGRDLDLDQLLDLLHKALWEELTGLESQPARETHDSPKARLAGNPQTPPYAQPAGKLPERYGELHDRYEGRLYRKGAESRFSTAGGGPFAGVIQGVDTDGRLLVATDREGVQAYGFKEIRLHYGPESG